MSCQIIACLTPLSIPSLDICLVNVRWVVKFQTWWYKILKEIIVFCELKYHEALKIFKIWPFKAELLQKTELNFLPREFLLVKFTYSEKATKFCEIFP